MSESIKADLSPTITITADKICTTTDATGGYSTYDPYAATSTTSIYTDDLSKLTYTYPITTSTTYPITVETVVSQDDLDKATEKINKHIDELEEDIDYFDDKVKEQDKNIETIKADYIQALNRMSWLETKLENTRTENERLNRELVGLKELVYQHLADAEKECQC